jgi:hypothetical protein
VGRSDAISTSSNRPAGAIRYRQIITNLITLRPNGSSKFNPDNWP